MSRYYLHLRDFRGDVLEDEEGSNFTCLAAARDEAMLAMQELLANAIRHGEGTRFEAVIVADEHGRRVASVPVAAVLPVEVVDWLKRPSEAIPPDKFEEYRRNADACRAMAENTGNADDKASWLKLADAWLQMLPQHRPAISPDLPAWPEPSDEDSKVSH